MTVDERHRDDEADLGVAIGKLAAVPEHQLETADGDQLGGVAATSSALSRRGGRRAPRYKRLA
ncbi:MAG: hypothetical protein M3022_19260 [Actinomycetota bacterium]|nr:hypothetical protein [Actinomycetota bacterium]